MPDARDERTAEDAAISAAQATEIARPLAKHDRSKNHNQGAFGAVYRRVRSSTNKKRQERYAAVLSVLEEWRCELHTLSMEDIDFAAARSPQHRVVRAAYMA